MSARIFRILLLNTLLCISASQALSQNDNEVRSIALDSISVKTYRRTVGIKNRADGALVWDMASLSRMPQILSSADPIRYTQFLPGIQTNNEYQSGIHVLGCDNEHNIVSIGGAPLYNVAHLLGFFSSFNAPHYKTMTLRDNAPGGDFANRLGAELTMLPSTEISDSLKGECSVGMLSSQGTLRLPFKNSSALTLSLRASYIDLFYSPWLNIDGSSLKYTFYDLNATYVKHFRECHSLIFDAYSGIDRAKLSTNPGQLKTKDKWGNNMGAVHWIFTPNKDFTTKTTLYCTSYGNRLGIALADEKFGLKSSITDLALRNHSSWKNFSAGAEFIYHDIQPQTTDGSNTSFTDYNAIPATKSLEASVYVGWAQPILKKLKLSTSLRSSIYATDGKTYSALDPSAELRYASERFSASLNYSLRHQYLFQTGFSDMGLPVEFWLSASKELKPQYGHGLVAKAEIPLFNKRYQLSLSAHYKRLFRQVEYSGNALDLITTNYDFRKHLLQGEGQNYGVSAMLTKCSGRLTGWLSYAYNRARRKFPTLGEGEIFPASHERPHELNVVGTYKLSEHWDFGATFVFCSGTPYTAPVSAYFLNGSLISKYGKYNGARMSDYLRLDLSANYRWSNRRRIRQGFNLSIYNATCTKNDIFHYVHTNKKDRIYYRTVGFIEFMLPSLSYFFKW